MSSSEIDIRRNIQALLAAHAPTLVRGNGKTLHRSGGRMDAQAAVQRVSVFAAASAK